MPLSACTPEGVVGCRCRREGACQCKPLRCKERTATPVVIVASARARHKHSGTALVAVAAPAIAITTISAAIGDTVRHAHHRREGGTDFRQRSDDPL